MTRPFLALCLTAQLALGQSGGIEPVSRVYKTTPQGELKLHLFVPPDSVRAESRAAIIVLHGGGWHTGEPSWTFGIAQRYASLGLVAVPVQYRLSDQKEITPIDALEDVRDAVRWLRRHADELGIEPGRIAAHGSSAGAHLATVAALTPSDDSSTNGAPNAVIANSLPAAVWGDGWFTRILLSRATPEEYSPDKLVKRGAPPVFVYMGEDDSLTPASRARAFCTAMTAVDSRCDLQTYPKLGHLLTRNLDPRAQETGPFDTDPAAAADARSRAERFLAELGFVRLK